MMAGPVTCPGLIERLNEYIRNLLAGIEGYQDESAGLVRLQTCLSAAGKGKCSKEF